MSDRGSVSLTSPLSDAPRTRMNQLIEAIDTGDIKQLYLIGGCVSHVLAPPLLPACLPSFLRL